MPVIVVGVIMLCAEPASAQQNINSMTLRDVGDAALQWRLPLLGGLTLLIFALLWAIGVVQPGSLKKAGLRDLSPFPWPMWLFAAIIIFITMAMSQELVAKQVWLTSGDPASLRGIAATSIGVYALTLVVAIGMLMLFSRSASGAGLKTTSSDLPLGIICLVIALPAILLVSDLLRRMYESISGVEMTAVAHPMLRQIVSQPEDVWTWALIGSAVIGAPVVEEIIYRAFFQSAILKWTGMPWIAILVTSALFAGAHAVGNDAVDYYALGPIFVLSIAMGLAYERTKHIGVPIVMHMGFNALNIAIALWGTAGVNEMAMPTTTPL
jgi:membrane protease YdiL (CAAX protease family)